jgi:hypothetical protein
MTIGHIIAIAPLVIAVGLVLVVMKLTYERYKGDDE